MFGENKPCVRQPYRQSSVFLVAVFEDNAESTTGSPGSIASLSTPTYTQARRKLHCWRNALQSSCFLPRVPNVAYITHMQTTHASVLRYISTSFGSRACLSLSHQSGHNPKHTHVKTSESTLVYHIHPTIDYCLQSSFDRKTFGMSRSCIIPTTANFLGGSGTNPPPNTPEKPKGGKRYRLGGSGTAAPPNTPEKPKGGK